MLPATFPALVIILLAIVPGYVATSYWARNRWWKAPTTDLLTVLQSISVSVVIVGIMSVPAYLWFYSDRDHLDLHPLRLAVWVLLTAYFVPMVGGILFGRLFDRLVDPTSLTMTGRLGRFLAPVLPTVTPPTIWDWAFKSGVPNKSFVLVEYLDKTRIAGVFSQDSVAFTSPQPPGLYLSQEWTVGENGDLLAEIPHTRGVIIVNTANIRSVRILRGGEVSGQGRQVIQQQDGE